VLRYLGTDCTYVHQQKMEVVWESKKVLDRTRFRELSCGKQNSYS